MILSLVFVLVIGATFGATLAWLKAESDTVVNVFTVGKVSIELLENTERPIKLSVDSDKTMKFPFVVTEDKPVADWFKVIPGESERKQPYVVVKKDSEQCYIYMLVKNEFDGCNVQDSDGKFVPAVSYDVDTDNWTVLTNVDIPTGYTLYRYNKIMGGNTSTDERTEALFDTVDYSKYITSDNIASLNDKNIEIKAFAIQSNDIKDGEKSRLEVANDYVVNMVKNIVQGD